MTMHKTTTCKECKRKVKLPRKYCWQHSSTSSSTSSSSSTSTPSRSYTRKFVHKQPSSSNNTYVVKRSTRSGKKIMIITPSGKKVHFGQAGASDYTKHKDYERMMRYLTRHAGNMKNNAKDVTTSRREKWGKNGLATPGFWSRWLLWNLPGMEESARDIEKRFGIKVKLQL